MADVKALVSAWTGTEPSAEQWRREHTRLEAAARARVEEYRQRAVRIVVEADAAQRNAARFRLIEELGRMLICFAPDTDDLNGKFHRLATEATPTADRLQKIFQRLQGYPTWEPHHITELREFRDGLAGAQVRTRLTGRELDAALDDPRWLFAAST